MRLTLLFCFVMLHAFAIGQQVTLAPDSTLILFPDNVEVHLYPSGDGKQFIISGAGLQTLIVQYNYLTARMSLSSEELHLYQRQLELRDSINHFADSKSNIAQQRATVYAEAYADSQLVSEKYDELLKNSLDEISVLKKTSRRERRKFIVRGTAGGFMCGLFVGALLISIAD